MLQWTCRLRDVLERQLIEPERAKLLSTMTEAKFICDGGLFPDDFRWETLAGCYSQKAGYIDLGTNDEPGYLPIDPNCPSYQAVRSLSGKDIADLTLRNINVLWLSRNVFISQIFFSRRYMCGYKYELTFLHNWSRTSIFVYTLSFFEHDEQDLPSPIPVDFLRHVTACLPPGYFSKVVLDRHYPARCPFELVFQIASCILSHVDNYSPPREGQRTTFAIGGSHKLVLTKEELKRLVCHPFHPSIKLAFRNNIRFEETVSLTTLKDLLQESCAVRAINLPHALVDAGSMTPSLYFGHLILNLPDLSIEYEEGLMSPACLHGMVATYPIMDIRMTFNHHFWEHNPERQGLRLRQYIQPLLLHHSSIERLFIRFDHEGCHDEFLSPLLKTMPSVLAGCASGKLCFVNIALICCYEEPEVFFSRDLDNIQWSLNETLFPRLVLNYRRNHLPKPLEGRVVPSAIKAVNEGNIYRKATNLVASSMGTANAGLIFHIVKAATTG
jgi:hypothetical protein